MQVNLDEVITYLRELLDMNKTGLLEECGDLPNPVRGRIKTSELVAYVLERKFDKTAKIPLIAQAGGSRNINF